MAPVLKIVQRMISNNDMDDSPSGPAILDGTTLLFLKTIFNVLQQEDAIVITGSCVVAFMLQKMDLPSFLPGDIDIFVKQNIHQQNNEEGIFDRYFLKLHILAPLFEQHHILTQPDYIPIKNGPVFQKYMNCKLDILQIMEFGLIKMGESVPVNNRPKIQIIVVGGNCPIPPEPPLRGLLSLFERKVVTSFDLDIVQGAFHPEINNVTFLFPDTLSNIRKKRFWYVCDSGRPFGLDTMMPRVQKYIDREFRLMGFKDIMHPGLKIYLTEFSLSKLSSPFEPDIDIDSIALNE
jgi:hypothetical protein